MRRRFLLPVGGMLACLPIVYFAAPPVVSTIQTLTLRGMLDDDGLGKFDGWRPAPKEIAAAVGVGSGTYKDSRHQKFADLFKKRFRDNGVAIGARFDSDSKLRVMCAATIPRWDMARVALRAREEATNIFARPVDVDIYETFISIRQRKIGEVRPEPSSNRMRVVFDNRFALAESKVSRGPAHAFSIRPAP